MIITNYCKTSVIRAYNLHKWFGRYNSGSQVTAKINAYHFLSIYIIGLEKCNTFQQKTSTFICCFCDIKSSILFTVNNRQCIKLFTWLTILKADFDGQISLTCKPRYLRNQIKLWLLRDLRNICIYLYFRDKKCDTWCFFPLYRYN